MTQEMKLLMALTEALGFEVKKHVDRKEQIVSENEGHMIINARPPHPLAEFRLVGEQGSAAYVRDDNGGYIKQLIKPEISYTVEKVQ